MYVLTIDTTCRTSRRVQSKLTTGSTSKIQLHIRQHSSEVVAANARY